MGSAEVCVHTVQRVSVQAQLVDDVSGDVGLDALAHFGVTLSGL